VENEAPFDGLLRNISAKNYQNDSCVPELWQDRAVTFFARVYSVISWKLYDRQWCKL